MNKKTTGISAVISTILLCGCPGLWLVLSTLGRGIGYLRENVGYSIVMIGIGVFLVLIPVTSYFAPAISKALQINAPPEEHADTLRMLNNIVLAEMDLKATQARDKSTPLEKKIYEFMDFLERNDQMIKSKGVAIIPDLCYALGHSDPDIRKESCRALGVLGETQGLPDEAILGMTKLITDPEKKVREQVLVSFKNFANKIDLAMTIPVLVDAFKTNKDSDIHKQAIVILQTMGKKDAPALESLRVLADDPDPAVASAANIAILALSGEFERLDKVAKARAENMEVYIKDPVEAVDDLLGAKLNAIPYITKADLENEYQSMVRSWKSTKLYSGSLAKIKSIILKNAREYASESNFDEFVSVLIKNEQCAQLMANFSTYPMNSFCGIRLWRTKETIYVCGNSDFHA